MLQLLYGLKTHQSDPRLCAEQSRLKHTTEPFPPILSASRTEDSSLKLTFVFHGCY